jgi:hypothetical protein
MQYSNLRSRIAIAWAAMFFTFVTLFVFTLVQDAIVNDFTRWAADPGPVAFRRVTVLAVVYIVMPVLVSQLEARWFRWLAVAVAAFIGLFVLAHQVGHALTQSRPFDLLHVFDFLHHALALWVVVLSVRWAREAPVQGMAAAPAY